MSDQSVLDQVSISQSMRFYWFQYSLPGPIPKEEIISHSTNVHVIPATPAIASQCTSLRAGDLVHLSGDLVEATGHGIGTWRSSLSRTDTGNGAFELMWVNELSMLSVQTPQDRAVLVKRWSTAPIHAAAFLRSFGGIGREVEKPNRSQYSSNPFSPPSLK